MRPDVRDKLYSIFMQRLVQVWRDEMPNSFLKDVMNRGGFSTKERRDIDRKWGNYLYGMGVKMQSWSEAMHQKNEGDILIYDPWNEKSYIVVPYELAIKALTLGYLP